jgi:hypothetical protein
MECARRTTAAGNGSLAEAELADLIARGALKQSWGATCAYRERRASKLNGPAPKWEINSAPPSMETFFINMAT